MNLGFLLNAYYLINNSFNEINGLYECMHLIGRKFTERPCYNKTVDCYGLKLKAWLYKCF
jgi:hypothetical protein